MPSQLKISFFLFTSFLSSTLFLKTQWLCTNVWSIDHRSSPLSVHRNNTTGSSYNTTLQNVIPAVTRVTRDLILRAPNWGCLLTDQKTDCRLSLCGDQYKLHKPYMNYIFSYQFNIFGPCDINTGTYQMMTQVERASWRLPITRLGWNIKLFIRFTHTFWKVRGGGGIAHLSNKRSMGVV